VATTLVLLLVALPLAWWLASTWFALARAGRRRW
jgi:ABC-type spermidine/putrescine transport system permease subunit I